jgi:antitoxin (DNA-binding transcriptional repressor) of toxin-antitoxin stability system
VIQQYLHPKTYSISRPLPKAPYPIFHRSPEHIFTTLKNNFYRELFFFGVCRKKLILLAMEKVAIGEVSRGGGFPRLVRRVEEGGQPLVIMKKNEAVAIILPCPNEMEQYLNQYYAMIDVLRSLVVEDREGDARSFLAMQVALGESAKVFLAAFGTDLSALQTESNEILSRMGSVVNNIQHTAVDKPLSNHDNLDVVVPKVQQEELPIDGNPSVSRKPDRQSKKDVSPLPKAKIGTKRETSA